MRATARLTSTAKTTVMPNLMKNCPEMPGISATGRNTATIAIVVQHGQADFVSRIDGGLICRLSHAHVTHDILDLYNGIVQQHACNQAERQQADTIERKIHKDHEPEGRDR